MTSPIEMPTGAVVQVEAPVIPTLTMPAPESSTIPVLPVPGIQGKTGPAGDSAPVFGEVPIGLVNGQNTIFETASPYQPGSTVLYVNGIREIHYTESAEATITIEDAPWVGAEIVIDYLLQ